MEPQTEMCPPAGLVPPASGCADPAPHAHADGTGPALDGEAENRYRLHRRFDRMGRLVGDAGMERLFAARVLVVGLGGRSALTATVGVASCALASAIDGAATAGGTAPLPTSVVGFGNAYVGPQKLEPRKTTITSNEVHGTVRRGT